MQFHIGNKLIYQNNTTFMNGGINPNVSVLLYRKDVSYYYITKNPQYLLTMPYEALGVLIQEGDKSLIVAVNHSPEKIQFSSTCKVISQEHIVKNYQEGLNDFNGKENTQRILAASSDSCITNTINYPAGYCNLYSRSILLAGQWWLPSLGELLMIHRNRDAINKFLYYIKDSTPIFLNGDWYWTSTETHKNDVFDVGSSFIGAATMIGAYGYKFNKNYALPVTNLSSIGFIFS